MPSAYPYNYHGYNGNFQQQPQYDPNVGYYPYHTPYYNYPSPVTIGPNNENDNEIDNLKQLKEEYKKECDLNNQLTQDYEQDNGSITHRQRDILVSREEGRLDFREEIEMIRGFY